MPPVRPLPLIPALLLSFLIAASLAAAIPVATPIAVRAAGDQWNPAVASDGRDFLAVWSDSRGGVYATRVLADGSVLDPFGLPIANGGETPAVSWDGSRYIIVWNDYFDLYATPVTRDGAIGEAVAIGQGFNPSIASNGAGSVVAARGSRGILTLISFTQALDVVAVREAAISMSDGRSWIAPLGSGYLVAWINYVDEEWVVRALRTTPDLPPNRPIIDLAPDGVDVRIAGDGERVLVLFRRFDPELDRNRNPNALPTTIGGVVVSADAIGEVTTLAEAEEGIDNYSAASTTTGFAIVWMKKVGEVETGRTTPRALDSPSLPFHPIYDLHRTDVQRDGTARLDTEFASSARSEFQPAIATNGDLLFAVWLSDGINAALAAGAGDPEPVALAKSATEHESPAVAWAGDRYVVVWLERNRGERVIYARTISVAGTFLEAAPIAITTPAKVLSEPAIACDDESCLVAWATWDGAFGRRFRKSGEMVDDAPLMLSPPGGLLNAPAVAAGSDGFAVLAYGPEVSISYIDAGGVVGQQEVAAIGPQASINQLALAYDGSAFIATWSRSATRTIEAARVVRGQPSNAVLITDGRDASRPSVDCSGKDCVIAWQVTGDAVAAMRFSDGIAIPIRPGNVVANNVYGTDVRVTFARNRFLIAWMEFFDGRVRMRGTFMSRDGHLTSIGTLLPENAGPFSGYDIAGSGDQLAIVYGARVTTPPSGGAKRVFLDLSPTPVPERRRSVRR